MSSQSNEPTEDNYFTIEPVITISLILAINFLFLNLIIGCIPVTWLSNISLKIFVFAILSSILLFLTILFGIYWLMLGGKNYEGVLPYISVIIIVPTIAVIFLLVALPNTSIGIFENTIGYFYCINRYKTKINEIFDVKDGIPEAYKNSYQGDKSVLISLFKFQDVFDNPEKSIDTDIYNFDFTKNKDGNVIDSLKELQNIVSVKNTIGIFSWFFIVSLCSSIISLKVLTR